MIFWNAATAIVSYSYRELWAEKVVVANLFRTKRLSGATDGAEIHGERVERPDLWGSRAVRASGHLGGRPAESRVLDEIFGFGPTQP